MNSKKPIQYSITWLLLAVTIVAHLLVSFVYLVGAEAIVKCLILGIMLLGTILLWLITVKVGSTASVEKNSTPFWQAISAYAVLFFTLWITSSSDHIYYFKTAVLLAIFLGTGLGLSIASISRGTRSTKTYVIPALLFFIG